MRRAAAAFASAAPACAALVCAGLAGRLAAQQTSPPPAQQTPHAAAAQPDPALGKQLASEGNQGGAAPCSSCHGMDGAADQGGGSFPRLAGQPAEYLYKQLNDYASGARPNEIMGPIASALSDAERQATAAYFSPLDPPYPAPQAADPASLKLGAALLMVGSSDRRVQACANCHGPDGAGQAPLYPALAGQYVAYAQAQLEAFRNKDRHNDVAGVMREIAGELTEDEIAAVSAYFAANPPEAAR